MDIWYNIVFGSLENHSFGRSTRSAVSAYDDFAERPKTTNNNGRHTERHHEKDSTSNSGRNGFYCPVGQRVRKHTSQQSSRQQSTRLSWDNASFSGEGGSGTCEHRPQDVAPGGGAATHQRGDYPG